jgi:hypothetical protein
VNTTPTPTIVCVIGSALLAPLTLITVVIGITLLEFALNLHIHLPPWLVWSFGILALVLTPLSIWNLYNWYFNKCHQRRSVASKPS